MLNPISTFFLKPGDGRNEIKQITDEVRQTLNQPVADDLIWLTLQSLKNENLVKVELTTPPGFKGLTRRRMIRQVGLTAGAVSLPMVISIVAPAAANAQSGIGASVDVCSGTERGIGQDSKKNAEWRAL